MKTIPMYLKKHSMTQAAFAEMVGVTQGMVWQWCHGLKPITPEKAFVIEKCTKGALTRVALRPDVFG